MTDEQINAKCAEILGIFWVREKSCWQWNISKDCTKYFVKAGWKPVKDLNQAAMVAERVGYWIIYKRPKPQEGYLVWCDDVRRKAPTFNAIPRALCMAAIKAYGQEKCPRQ